MGLETCIVLHLPMLFLDKHFLSLFVVVQVKGLAFNQMSPNLLASGGADGDIIIWDIANPKKPNAFPPYKARLSCLISVTLC